MMQSFFRSLSICTAFVLVLRAVTRANTRNPNYFKSPVDHTVKLAGSFGELRKTHFHAGMDIKPSGNKTPDVIRASADGFVSRIKISTRGYGEAVYIDHPNGYTTVYAHLDKLDSALYTYVMRMQREAGSYEVDLYPAPDAFPMKQGDVIGIMGNTGHSYATHLHYEIRHTATEVPEDPALWGIGPTDSKAPTLISVGLEGFTDTYRSTNKQIFYSNQLISTQPIYIPAWRIGVDIQAFDQMDGSNNQNGIHHRRLYVDDQLHWASTLDAIPWESMHLIDAYINYNDKVSLNRTAVRAYCLPGLQDTSLADTRLIGSLIPIYKDKATKIKIELEDLSGNMTTAAFVVFRSDHIPEPDLETYHQVVKWDTSTQITIGDLSLLFPKTASVHHQYITMEVQHLNGLPEANIGKPTDLMLGSHPLRWDISQLKLDSSLRSKLCLIWEDDKKWKTYGGTIVGDSLVTPIDKFGHYKMHIDTIPPSIVKVSKGTEVTAGESIQFIIKDDMDHAGNAKDVKIEIYVDGDFTPCRYKTMTDQLWIQTTAWSPGSHTLGLIVTDDRGNSSTATYEIHVR